ncbi:hypothetical protein QTA56_17160 [Acinetobacter sp. VNH17]|uniref:C2H2-type domain-containing protein n=1 Tax=Acinetobacter thutiue TaxID=2998078 RepID=A0ABT7WTD7_9GAMM|nr:hypothetical protein [Acinetobacter thutiue]MCY6413838.1 hypothetical protein [Acinetobacter thutiue]MDN0015947.1 hypothetical protein [Acinetobacter thutiue]
MRSYECSCAGENENCFKCYGTGTVVEEISPSAKYKVLSSKVVTNEVVKEKVVKNKMSYCSFCKEQFLEEEIKEHIRTSHGLNNKKKEKFEIQVLKCSKKTPNLAQLVGISRRKKKKKTSNKLKNKAKMNSSQVNSSYESGRDMFDATKDYAHNFREHGRYGSHPIHDDYDEIDND